MNSTVKDVMSTHVMAVRQAAPYKDMAAMLHDQRISAFPVIDDDNKVIGVVSETDLLTKEALEATVPRTLRTLTRERVRSQVNAVNAADPADVTRIQRDIEVRGHHMFAGKLDPQDLTLAQRASLLVFRGMDGDFRDWAAITQWAESIAADLAALPHLRG
jgi:CBS domain